MRWGIIRLWSVGIGIGKVTPERPERGRGEWGSGVKIGRNLIGGVLEFYVSCYLPAFAVGVCSVVYSYWKCF